MQQIRGFHAILEIEHLIFLLLLPFFINPWGDEPFFISREWLLSVFIVLSLPFLKDVFIEVKRIYILIFLLIVLSLLSALLSGSKFYSLTRSLAIFGYASYFLITVNILSKKENYFLAIAFVFSITSFINAFYAILQFYGIDPIFSPLPFFSIPERVLPSRIGGFLGGPIPLISFLSTTAPVALSLSLSRTKKFIRLIGFLSYLFSLYVSALAGKRIGMVAILSTSLFFGILYVVYIESSWKRPKLFLLFIAILCGMGISCVREHHPLLLNQLKFTELYRGLRERINIWYYTGHIIAKKPLFGSGPGTFKFEFFDEMVEEEEREGFISKDAIPKREGVLYFQPHNIFLEIASDTGFFCLFLFLFLLIEIFLMGIKRIKDREDVIFAGFFLSIISFLIFSFLQPSLNFPVSVVYAITSAGVILSASERGEKRRISSLWFSVILIPFFLYTSTHLIGDCHKRYGKIYLLGAIDARDLHLQTLLINESERRLRKALRYAPYDGEGRYWLGYLYCVTGRTDMCIDELERAKKAFRSGELYFNLGSAYETVGNLDEALLNFSIAYAYNNLPQALERIRRHDREYLTLIEKWEAKGLLKEVKIMKRIYPFLISE